MGTWYLLLVKKRENMMILNETSRLSEAVKREVNKHAHLRAGLGNPATEYHLWRCLGLQVTLGPSGLRGRIGNRPHLWTFLLLWSARRIPSGTDKTYPTEYNKPLGFLESWAIPKPPWVSILTWSSMTTGWLVLIWRFPKMGVLLLPLIFHL